MPEPRPTFKYLTKQDLSALLQFVTEHVQYDEGETREHWEAMADRLFWEHESW